MNNAKPSEVEQDRTRDIYAIAIEHSPDGVFTLTRDLELTLVNQTIESLVGVPRDELVGSHASIFRELGVVEQDHYSQAIDACTRVLEGDADSEQFEIQLHPGSGPITADYRIERVRAEAVAADLVGTFRDISTRVEQRQQIERQRNDLNTVSQIQTLIHTIIQSLSSSTTRDEINRVVCDTLAHSDHYAAAWIGYTARAPDTLQNVYAAGLDADHRDAIDCDSLQEGPTFLREAIETGQMQVCHDPTTDARLPNGLRGPVRQSGYESGIAIPLTIEGTVFAVLTVWTRRANAFTGREKQAVEVLGEMVAFALTAVENVQLLQSESAIELTFRIPEGVMAAELSEQFDCDCFLDGIVPHAGDGLRCYFSVEGAAPGDILDLTEDHATVRRIEVIEDAPNSTMFEVVMDESPLKTLVEAGVQVRSSAASDGTASLTVHLGPDRDPAAVLDTVESVYPEVELVSKQSVTGPPQSMTDLNQWLNDNLTTKQRSALEAAYFQGYFDWPRTNTAEEIATSFDVASSTYHAHLRKAINQFLAAVFEPRTGNEQ